MRITKYLLVAVAALLLTASACNNKTHEAKYPTDKRVPNDPFAETMVASEFFDIDPERDNIIEAVHGTVVYIPEGALLDKHGKPAKGPIKLELAEALDVEDMVLSNLTTTADGKLLQSGGMLYINATANGEPLHVDTNKPLRIEMPTDIKIDGMMAYRGIRDSAGNMNWVDPLPLIKYLTPVNLSDLDFLPEGFYDTVQNNMPYRGHLTADRNLADSLYYSLSIANNPGATPQAEQPQAVTDMNEAQYNLNREIKNGKYTDESFDVKRGDAATPTENEQARDSTAPCGINPASIKVIKGDKFKNTFIATREFEARMKHIHHTCKQAVLEIYINNLDKNLWEADKMVFDLLTAQNNPEAKEFERFYNEKLTKVKDGDKASEKLAEYYRRQLSKTEEALQKLRDKEQRKLEKEAKKFEEVKEEYREVLWKREEYRNEKYGFEWTDFGWVNVDTGWVPKECPTAAKLEITVTNAGTSYDRVYTYVLLTSIKSLYRLNTTDYKEFYAGNPVDRILDMPCNEPTTAIVIGYKGKQAYYAETFFTATRENKITISDPMKEVSDSELKNILKQQNSKYKSFNNIEKDLKFQEKFYQEELRQKVLRSEQEFTYKLYRVAFGCCFWETIPAPAKADSIGGN
jgi:hypothetical protein